MYAKIDGAMTQNGYLQWMIVRDVDGTAFQVSGQPSDYARLLRKIGLDHVRIYTNLYYPSVKAYADAQEMVDTIMMDQAHKRGKKFVIFIEIVENERTHIK